VTIASSLDYMYVCIINNKRTRAVNRRGCGVGVFLKTGFVCVFSFVQVRLIVYFGWQREYFLGGKEEEEEKHTGIIRGAHSGRGISLKSGFGGCLHKK